MDKAGLKDMVVYNNDRQPEAVQYEKISIYLLEIIKNQEKAIEQLEATVGRLEDGL